MKTMKAIVLEKPKVLKTEIRNRPVIMEDEVLVAVKCVGICGSDIHYYEHGKIGNYVVEKPLILGHEASGEVISIGRNVKKFNVGDKVVIEPGATCGKCEYCKSGRYNLCPDVKFLATPPVDGALCEYLAVKEDYLFKIPDNIEYDVATLVEPLSVGIHGAIRGNVKLGDKVLILGLGPVGLLTILAVKAFGASQIIAVDVQPLRLNAAKELGATHIINAKDSNYKQLILEATQNVGPDVTFETAGSKETSILAFEITKRGGRIVLIGLLPDNEVSVNINSIVDNEYNVYGVFRYANTYRKAIEVLSNNLDKVKKLITHRFKFDEAIQAFEFVRGNKDKCIKAVIVI
ncbi:Alcohol dehydrogenase GroES domain protein [Caldicellulosiruptor kronotskyensis 2002]|uniref:Alcohol dehydrogenase GroES domain protein n=1 Tax=Caldicellulosiruptor kronotskyensis (strain DSM 18902 / VKM B-2412 / 2002) TaxID=632348 RepID=E4SEJ0_CALK2|nr:Alcohol dehydrogenase GroES domain protein [Caldicellulosiruptor kronotskyensis 2002]